eukprot:scaffold14909_cov107-Isochrysis_galbana.AAC.3
MTSASGVASSAAASRTFRSKKKSSSSMGAQRVSKASARVRSGSSSRVTSALRVIRRTSGALRPGRRRWRAVGEAAHTTWTGASPGIRRPARARVPCTGGSTRPRSPAAAWSAARQRAAA